MFVKILKQELQNNDTLLLYLRKYSDYMELEIDSEEADENGDVNILGATIHLVDYKIGMVDLL